MTNLIKKSLSAALLLTILLLAGCSSLPWADKTEEATPAPTVSVNGAVSAEGGLAPLRSSTLSFYSSGELGELLVSEGENVAEGAILARLGKREPLEAALSQAKLELLAAQQALDDLDESAEVARQQANQALVTARAALNDAQQNLERIDTDDYQEELDERKIAVEDAEGDLEDAEETLDKYKDLDPDNRKRKRAQTAYDNALDDYDDAVYDLEDWQNLLSQAQTAVDLATANVEDAQRVSDNRANGVDPDTLSLAQARLDAAQDQVAASQRALDNTELAAPYAGTIVELHDLEPGETVLAGQAVVTLADFSAWIVETRDLTELDVVNVAVGQAVKIIPDALPDLELSGVVETINAGFTERSGDILYTVRIRLEESDPRLRWGMTVDARFK